MDAIGDGQSKQVVDQIGFRACEHCNGLGEYKKRTCRQCGGLGIIGAWKNVTIRWGHGFTAQAVLAWELERAFFWLVNLLLIGISVWGILAFILVTASLGMERMLLLAFWLQPELLPLWIAIIADSFLFYRIVIHRQAKVTLHDIALHPDKKYEFNVADVLSDEVWQVLKQLWQSAQKTKQSEIGTIHLFNALLETQTVKSILVRLGLDYNRMLTMAHNVAKRYATTKQAGQGSAVLHPDLKEVFLTGFVRAAEHNLQHVEAQSVLLALLEKSPDVSEIFLELQADEKSVEQVIGWFNIDKQIYGRYKRFRRFAVLRPKSNLDRAMTAVATPMLDQFSNDVTQLASYGRLTFCVGRNREVRELFRLVEGGAKSVALVGPEGVGKSTIIHSIAEKMITEEVPELLKDKRLVALSIPKLLAGAGASGQVEQRMLLIRDEIVRSGNIVLLIENIHDLVGAGGQGEAGLDTSELVARIIERESFPVIATSNPIDWRRFIEGKALGAVLQNVTVDEPDEDSTMAIMQSKVNGLEHRFSTYFSYAALRKIIELSERYMHDQVLPEKALRIMEEIAVYVKNNKGIKKMITADDVAHLISEKIDIPVTQITQAESERLLNLEDIIHRRLINQEEAVKAVASALRRARTQLRDETRPIVNLLFLGPTGVGKTELAKTVAAVYFGNEHEILRLDMSEYQNKSSLSRLIGSESDPTGGYLTEGIKRKPFTVLLLDELEKAHPDILDVFLQVMDDGRLTDWSGKTINFTNVILIATSNAGTQYIQEETKKGTTSATIAQHLVRDRLKEHFRPEFLNRFDNIVVFKPLSKEHIKQVAALMLEKNKQRLSHKGVELQITDAALEELAQQGFDPLFGARPMRRLIQDTVDDAIARFLLKGRISRRDIVILDTGGRIKVKKAAQIE